MKRLVIKVGTAVLTQGEELALQRMKNLVNLISTLKNDKNLEVILVSSGAVGAGYTELKLDKTVLANKQTLAAIGQPKLMKTYQEMFQEFGITVAQMLFIADDFDSRKRSKNAKNVMEILLQNKVIPIINENDVIATEELIGDNDQLAAYITHYFKADMLVILTDIDGYYDKNPREFSDAKIQKIINEISQDELDKKPSANSKFATGGIVTKLKAADFLMQKNIPMYLTSGFDLTNAYDFLVDNNHKSGTIFKK
ncbi:glutamate 5-kinase [Aliarcobacter cryaerophilus]|jgi:glutamate 5-kinase|uniref:Glutamate 5-kinase n=3 Tax=unclassified Arcobacter TaxID=2593671 RepID=A0AA96IHU5_9BACT|nr:glutamate 5-kinase [Aliarcobacter cryaerophilus]OQA74456.1 MAG: Glutamate 5-kinase [Candidatus Dependentiae bacterium ADurb.Bin246]WNL27299.1 glutamate 5-kinase [Arcobacter sp. AZ-2023]WPD05548.1 glutamate 5-kinase [Arcobacter sp. DSM 115956]WPD07640.1 glutamate 5-kinase [Arcobacter sp. DSM 115955]MCT7431857.1 glutamate 5-kinase [Aliarcobacter cryaerophilus]